MNYHQGIIDSQEHRDFITRHAKVLKYGKHILLSAEDSMEDKLYPLITGSRA